MIDAIQANLLSPAVLFFLLGIFATLAKSDLKFPEPLYVGLTIYLLVAIGFKGGAALAASGFHEVWLPLLAAIAVGAAIPLWCYPILRGLGRLPTADAAAIAAHYGSVSAVTFVAATNFLRTLNVPFEGYAPAFLAVMETPAIVVGVILGHLVTQGNSRASTAAGAKADSDPAPASPRHGDTQRWFTALQPALHEGLFGRSVVLLAGALVVGILSGERGLKSTAGLFVEPFQGLLALFLLEMGMVAARRFGELRRVGPFLLAFGIVMPIVNGVVGICLARVTGLSMGGAMLFATLAASASYIAAPAAMRLSLPEANPTLYLTSALAVTFPFNITVGLPLYYAIASWLYGGHA